MTRFGLSCTSHYDSASSLVVRCSSCCSSPAFVFMRQRRATQCIIQGKLGLIYYIHVSVSIHNYSSDDASMYVPPFMIDAFFTIEAEPSQRVVRC